jgi:hypothetical protein
MNQPGGGPEQSGLGRRRAAKMAARPVGLRGELGSGARCRYSPFCHFPFFLLHSCRSKPEPKFAEGSRSLPDDSEIRMKKVIKKGIWQKGKERRALSLMKIDRRLLR